LRLVVVVLVLSLSASGVRGQSIVSGEISGVVRDELARPMPGVHVVLTEVRTGLQHDRETGTGGRFSFGFLPTGTYQVFAERLGYRPSRVESIPVRPNRSIPLFISLLPATPPVNEVDVVQYDGAAVAVEGGAMARRFSALELSSLPHRSRDLAELGRLASHSTASLATEGLPGRMTGIVVDGIPFQGAEHPEYGGTELATAPFALSQFTAARLLAGGVDVEYGQVAGASLVGFTRRGTRRLQAKGFGDWSGDGLATSGHFDPRARGYNSIRGGVLITGAVIPDTAHFVLGGEVRRLQTSRPPAWAATPMDSAIVAIAADSFGVDLAPYLRTRLTTTELVSAFGGFDGRITSGNAVSLRASFARFSSENPEIGGVRGPVLASDLVGTDVSAIASLTSSLSGVIGLEVRAGLEFSEREYTSSAPLATIFTEHPVSFGVPATVPGRFQRVAFRINQAVHFNLGRHGFKIGGSATLAALDQSFAFRRRGIDVFSGPAEFAGLTGSFAQVVGPSPQVQFNTRALGGFLQDRWRVSPDLEFLLGFRIDGEYLPKNDPELNQEWLDQSGLSNVAFDRTRTRFNPRFGLRWDVGNRHRWLVRAEAGLYSSAVDPGLFAEAMTLSGRQEVREGVGSMGRWPLAPDSVVAPASGPELTLLPPQVGGPQTSRTSLAVSVFVTPETEFEASVTLRNTKYLPRRQNLNRLPSPVSQDQHGRPIYGTLVQQGAALAADPGTNRRFPDFGTVSALNVDGTSDYFGLSGRLERRFGSVLNFFASYTYSETNDNWLSGSGRGPTFDMSPFPDRVGREDWADGRSDFDIPHRITAGGQIDLALIRLAGVLRYQSGMPFTPGFREGVDANADGSFRNDPAFIDDAIPGTTDLLGAWKCLAGQVGQFAVRNSCRGEAIMTLDVRASLRLFREGDYPIELVVDGLNLLDTDIVELDRAVYLVDAGGSVATDTATRRTTVPLTANPNFGRPAYRRSFGRAVRLGMRVGY
jgi:hypothetical protein